jgi:hypothetical protein
MITIQIYPDGFNYCKSESWTYNKVQHFKNSRIKLKVRGASQEACHDAFIHRLPPTPAPSQAGSLQATHHQKHYLETPNYSKTYPSVIATSPTLDMKGFLAIGVLLLKINKEYVLTFGILA